MRRTLIIAGTLSALLICVVLGRLILVRDGYPTSPSGEAPAPSANSVIWIKGFVVDQVTGEPMNAMTEKVYRCQRCGFEAPQKTNHYGQTWSYEHFNTCSKCPPWAKYPEFGGSTIWVCVDTEKKIK